jgi:mRNA interferase ChpB
MRDRHRFVVITPQIVNALGMVMTVPITGGGKFSRDTGMTVPIIGHDTQGVAVCNQVRTFDVEARMKAGTARFVEGLDTDTAEEIVSRVLSIIDPEENTS